MNSETIFSINGAPNKTLNNDNELRQRLPKQSKEISKMPNPNHLVEASNGGISASLSGRCIQSIKLLASRFWKSDGVLDISKDIAFCWMMSEAGFCSLVGFGILVFGNSADYLYGSSSMLDPALILSKMSSLVRIVSRGDLQCFIFVVSSISGLLVNPLRKALLNSPSQRREEISNNLKNLQEEIHKKIEDHLMNDTQSEEEKEKLERLKQEIDHSIALFSNNLQSDI